ncbi:MAG: polysaccharide biosynthesis tyrosine autokinase [Clostridia bacterium]|nr:polysaccharide biosynthesis tyrosine autokinase [Clostridia bacterium]
MNNNTPQKDNTASTVEISVLLGDIWRGAKKFGWIAIALAVLLGGFQFYRSYVRFSPEYTVTATFTVHTENKVLSGDNGVSAYSFYYDRETADQLESVFPHIISNPILRQRVCEDLDVEAMPASVTAACVQGTNMITLTSKGGDPQLTYDTLLSVIDNYSYVAEYIIGRTKLVMINEPVVPEKPSNSNAWISSVFYAALIGLVLGWAWILVYAILRKTIRTKEDIADVLNQHCIGVLPQVVFKKYRREISKNLVLTNPLIGNEFLESLRLLRSSVQTSLGNNKVLMLTSTAPNEGKTVVTVNLAASFAHEEKSVLVIDADLRNSGLQIMLNEGRFERKLLTENDFFKIEHIEKLDFELLSFKPVIDSVQKIVRTANLKELLNALKSEFDLVIIDTPPCGMISDATIIAGAADTVAYVIRQDAVIQSNIRAGISSLLETETNFLGCILNGASSGFGSYGYYKYYRGGYSYKYGGYKKYGYSSNKKK